MDYRINYPVSVTGAHIFDDGVTIGAQGSQNAISLTLTFDETWDGLGKTIMWFGALDHDQQLCETVLAPSMRVDEDPSVYCVPFPQEIMQEAGKAAITIEGTETVDGETVVILTTEYGYFKVMASSNEVQDIDPSDNPQTILQQVLELVDDAEGYVTDAQASATAAAGSATAAAASAAQAQDDRSLAQGYATAAYSYKESASTSETNAAAYASAAQTSASSASTSASSASSYAQSAANSDMDAFEQRAMAQSYAQSANGYAQNAQASATAAAESASSASDSATSAANSATSAAESAAACQSMVAITDAELDAICV